MGFEEDDSCESVPLQNKSVQHSSAHFTNPCQSSYMSVDPSFVREPCCSITWRDVTVFVADRTNATRLRSVFCGGTGSQQNYKQVLTNVSGVVNAGTLLAVMGASGSGKTTLLNALANRLPRGSMLHGDIYLNGKECHQFSNRAGVGFVYQEDLFIGTLTVREYLTFRAALHLRGSKDISDRVFQLLTETGLLKCQNTRIGDPETMQGISGGERKRLALASEILTNPTVLFCDEPTSGLDSFTAQSVVSLLQELAGRGKSVICTIHQPSSEVFAMFDRLLLLAKGRTAFFGPTSSALDFFASLGFPSPPTYNPADHYIDTLAEQPYSPAESKEHIRRCAEFREVLPPPALPGRNMLKHALSQKICDLFVKSMYGQDLELQVAFSRAFGLHLDENETVQYVNENTAPWPTQVKILLWRGLLDSFRSPSAFAIRIGQKIFLGLIIGLFFMNVSNDQKGIMDKMGVIFLFVSENTFPTLYGVLQVFPKELPVFLRENKINLYGIGSYYLAKITTMTAACILEPTLFLIIAYWMIGLNQSTRSFVLIWVFVVLTANTAAACGCCFSAMFDSTSLAMTVLVPVDFILMTVAGTFISIDSLPSYISWAQYISWFRYANEGINIAAWDGVQNITCEWGNDAPCSRSGEEVLRSYGFESENLHWCIFSLAVLYGTWHLLGFAFLLRRALS